MFQIIVAFEGQSSCDRLRGMLESTGEFSCLVCRSAAQVKRAVGKQQAELVVCGFKLADESGEALYYDLPERCVMLMVGPQTRLELCAAPGIFKLTTPAGRTELLASVRMLVQLLQGREAHDRRAREEKELLSRAKTALMERRGMTEEQAHRFLQKRSMDSRARLADVADWVLDETGAGKDA